MSFDNYIDKALLDKKPCPHCRRLIIPGYRCPYCKKRAPKEEKRPLYPPDHL